MSPPVLIRLKMKVKSTTDEPSLQQRLALDERAERLGRAELLEQRDHGDRVGRGEDGAASHANVYVVMVTPSTSTP